MRLLAVPMLCVLTLTAFGGCLAEYLDELDTPDPDRWYLGPTGLTTAGPADAEMRLDWGWPEYLSGQRAPRFIAPAFDGPVRVVQANLTATYRLENVVATDAPVGGLAREPLTAWFGSEAGMVDHAFAPGPTAAAADEVTVVFEFGLPTGGLYLPPTVALRVDVASYYVGGVHLVLADSFLDVTYADSDIRIALDDHVSTSTDVLVGGRCILPDVASLGDIEDDISSVSHTLEVHGGHRYVAAFVVPTVDVRSDIDILVFGPDRSRIGHGAGSQAMEAVLYGPENIEEIGPGTWTVVAYTCSPQLVHANVGFGAIERF